MASYNKVLLMGNLTRDPEVTFTPSQVAICKFGLAVGRKFKTKTGEEKEKTTFVDCTAFDKRGEIINQYFTKGKPIFIEGTLELDQWDDKTTGQKRSKLYVIVENFQFVGGREGGGVGEGDAAEPSQPPPPNPRAPTNPAVAGRGAFNARPPQQQRPAPQQPFGDEQQFKEEDIPF